MPVAQRYEKVDLLAKIHQVLWLLRRKKQWDELADKSTVQLMSMLEPGVM